MKRLFIQGIILMLPAILMAGGIVTNQNQSAMYTRMQARDATLDIDAVFYNPAGLTLLPNDGFYFSLNNQTLGQNRTVNSDYPLLNSGEYEGTVSAPFFPGFYAAYKMGNLAFSLGFNPIGGGGGGVYEKGLPSFEYPLTDLVPATGADAYSVDAYFEGSSVMFGYQANISYKINDLIQIAIGGRFVTAKDANVGHMRNISLYFGGSTTPVPATNFFGGLATSATTAATSLNQIVAAGYGDLTIAEAEGAGIIDATQRAQLEGGLIAMGQDPATLNISQSESVYTVAAAQYGAYSVILQDQEADMYKKATGFTPIISVNIKPFYNLNIALKYEHNTKLEYTNTTSKDFISGFDPTTGDPITMFPDGEKTHLDIPALFQVGATFSPVDNLLLSAGYHLYFDKNANWGGREKEIETNSWEFAFGAEYGFSEAFKASLGYLRTKSYPTNAYQTDISQTLPSNTFGGGFAYAFSPKIELNLAGSYTMYEDGTKTDSRNGIAFTETYNKPIWIVGIGLNLNFGATK